MELPFQIRKSKQMIVFIGIQACGKTTFYKEWLACHGLVHINLDTRQQTDVHLLDGYTRKGSMRPHRLCTQGEPALSERCGAIPQ